MNSKEYLILADKISELYDTSLKELPLLLSKRKIDYSLSLIKEAEFFRKDLQVVTKTIKPEDKKCKTLLNFISVFLWKENLKKLESKEKITLNNLSNNITNSITKEKDCYKICNISLLALTILSLEIFIYYKLCNNKSEQLIKTTAHTLTNHLKLRIYQITRKEAGILIGSLKCAWIYAQNSEGINDI